MGTTMTTQNLALFKGLGAKMEYLNTHQRVIAQNIANADTPGYRAQGLKGADFSSVLKRIDSKAQTSMSVSQVATQSGHISGSDSTTRSKAVAQRDTYEVAPVGNTVIIEEQLINAQRTTSDYSLMTNLYRKNVGMLTTALGRN